MALPLALFSMGVYSLALHTLLFLKKPRAVAAKLGDVSFEQVFLGSTAEPLECASKATEVLLLSAGEPSYLSPAGRRSKDDGGSWSLCEGPGSDGQTLPFLPWFSCFSESVPAGGSDGGSGSNPAHLVSQGKCLV